MSAEGHASVAAVVEELEHRWGPCLALYQHGSSVFQNKEPADIDLLAVVDEPTLQPVRSATPDAQFKLDRFEVSVYTRSAWLQKLRLMDLSMLTCLSLPEKFVLREDAAFRDETRAVPLEPSLIFEFSRLYAEFTWLKAQALLRKGDVHKSCKNVSYVFRVLELAAQLLRHGRVVDFFAANCWWDRTLEAYTTLGIGERDWDAVEALFGRSFQEEVARVRRLAECGGGEPAEEEVAHMRCVEEPGGSEPFELQPFQAVLSVSEGGAGAPCSRPLAIAVAEAVVPLEDTVLVLPRCGHRLRCGSALALCRESSPDAACLCPVCQVPWRLDLDKDAVLRERARLRHAGEWRHVTRVGRGCRWDRLLEEAKAPPPEEGVEDEEEEEKPVSATQKAFVALRQELDEARAALQRALEALSACCQSLGFEGYPGSWNLDDQPKRAVMLDVRQGSVVGTGLAGDEVFRVATGEETTIAVLRLLIAEAVGVPPRLLLVLEGGGPADQGARAEDLRSAVASWSPGEAAIVKCQEEVDIRSMEKDSIRERLHELRQRLDEERAAARREKHQAILQHRARRQELWLAVRRQRDRLLGVVLRRAATTEATPWKAAAAERRSRSQLRAARRRAGLAAKAERLAAAAVAAGPRAARQPRQRRLGAGRLRSGRFGGFTPEFACCEELEPGILL